MGDGQQDNERKLRDCQADIGWWCNQARSGCLPIFVAKLPQPMRMPNLEARRA
jgi:hypothetical protein